MDDFAPTYSFDSAYYSFVVYALQRLTSTLHSRCKSPAALTIDVHLCDSMA